MPKRQVRVTMRTEKTHTSQLRAKMNLRTLRKIEDPEEVKNRPCHCDPGLKIKFDSQFKVEDMNMSVLTVSGYRGLPLVSEKFARQRRFLRWPQCPALKSRMPDGTVELFHQMAKGEIFYEGKWYFSRFAVVPDTCVCRCLFEKYGWKIDGSRPQVLLPLAMFVEHNELREERVIKIR